jgi:hypothetical protein
MNELFDNQLDLVLLKQKTILKFQPLVREQRLKAEHAEHCFRQWAMSIHFFVYILLSFFVSQLILEK